MTSALQAIFFGKNAKKFLTPVPAHAYVGSKPETRHDPRTQLASSPRHQLSAATQDTPEAQQPPRADCGLCDRAAGAVRRRERRTGVTVMGRKSMTYVQALQKRKSVTIIPEGMTRERV